MYPPELMVGAEEAAGVATGEDDERSVVTVEVDVLAIEDEARGKDVIYGMLVACMYW